MFKTLSSFLEPDMVKLVGAMMVVVGLMGAAWAADTAPATKAALPTCCGDTCKKMVNCCKEDKDGKTTCAMGGSCCLKTETKPAATAPAHDMGGMNMGH
jgi:hypothetical protein